MESKGILITYFSESGSTQLSAEKIGEYFFSKGFKSEICQVKDVNHLSNYNLIIIGTPNWYGKPAAEIQSFLKTNHAAFINTPVALFYTCMSVSEISGTETEKISVFKDPVFWTPSKTIKEMSKWEKTHAVSYYIENLEKTVPDFTPLALGFFKGNLTLSKLCFKHRIIMKLITLINKDVNEGEFLSTEALNEWAEHLLQNVVVPKKIKQRKKD